MVPFDALPNVVEQVQGSVDCRTWRTGVVAQSSRQAVLVAYASPLSHWLSCMELVYHETEGVNREVSERPPMDFGSQNSCMI